MTKDLKPIKPEVVVEPRTGNSILHSDTVQFLRARLVKAETKADIITAWLVIGFSLVGIFMVGVIVYLLLER